MVSVVREPDEVWYGKTEWVDGQLRIYHEDEWHPIALGNVVYIVRDGYGNMDSVWLQQDKAEKRAGEVETGYDWLVEEWVIGAVDGL